MKVLRSLAKRAKRLGSAFATRSHAEGGPAPTAPGSMLHAIDRYSYFQGVLRMTGWVVAPGEPISGLTWRSGDCRVPLKTFGADSPDVAAKFGSSAKACRFDETIRLRLPVQDVATAELEVVYRNGARTTIGGLGLPVADPAHLLYARFLEMIRERAPGTLLEVGSRARSGIVRRSALPEKWAYSGLDVMEGPNVDIVGDAHCLSGLYPAEHFDAVMAFSVLEHILMPWRFIVELNRILKIGAIGVFTTHQSWPLHDQPWDFWRFSDTAWAALLNPATGFEIIEAKMGEPAYVVALKFHPATAFAEVPAAALASSVLFRKIAITTLDWPVAPNLITGTMYPSQTIDVTNS
jgi:Methyltransferase domain